MKKILALAAFLLFFPVKAHAFQTTIWLSTNTNTVVSTATLCGQFIVNGTTLTQRGILHGVCINTAASGNLQIFASSWTGTNTMTGLFSTGTQQPCNFYDTESSNGLAFDKNGAADVTITYQCY